MGNTRGKMGHWLSVFANKESRTKENKRENAGRALQKPKKKRTFATKTHKDFMKRNTLLFAGLLIATITFAQTHVTIADPATWTTSELSRYTGQTIVFDCPMYVTNNYYGDLTIAPRRIFASTNQALPRSTEYNTIISLNNSGTMSLSGVSGYHRMGEKIYNLTVKVSSTTSLQYKSGDFVGNTRADLEAGLPDLGEYRLLVCTMNLEYYLVENLGTGYGPDNAAAHKKQRTKTGTALAKIGADIYGLVEIEQGQSALKEIAEDLTTHTGNTYTYIDDGGSASGSYTKSGYVYRSDKVRPYGQLYSNNEKVQNRKKIQAFEEIETGEIFIFSLNHFKAKSGSGSGLDADQGDGQGQFNYSRTQEAKSVIQQYNRLRSQYKDNDVLIMGDLNAYGKEDPITAFTNVGFIDLHRAFHADTSYSYTFHGQAGYLDHAICNASLRQQITGMAAYHINSDESDDYTYDKSNDLTMFRSSDHDPVLVGLKLDKTQTEATTDPIVNNFSVAEQDGKQVVVFSEFITIYNAYDSDESSFYAIYTPQGVLVEQGQIDTSPYIVNMPTEHGLYIVYVYAQGKVWQRKILVP